MVGGGQELLASGARVIVVERVWGEGEEVVDCRGRQCSNGRGEVVCDHRRRAGVVVVELEAGSQALG